MFGTEARSPPETTPRRLGLSLSVLALQAGSFGLAMDQEAQATKLEAQIISNRTASRGFPAQIVSNQMVAEIAYLNQNNFDLTSSIIHPIGVF